MIYSQKHRWIAFAVAILLLAFITWKLIQLPLWGHWCMPWFVIAWISIILIVAWKSVADTYSRKLLGLSTLSGLLLYLGFPTMPFTPLLFVAFIPILIVLNKIQSDTVNRKGRRVLFYSYNTFIIWNILSTFWVANTAFIAGIAAMGLNSFFMASVFWIFFKIHQKFSEGFRYWVLAALWISFEYLHLHWEISWSWLTLGNAFAQVHEWVQWYEYTGVFGGTLWVWVLNIFGFFIFRNWKSAGKKYKIIWLSSFSASILIPIVFSYTMYLRYLEVGTPLTVATVQPNFEPHYEKFDIPGSKQLERFIQLSASCIDDSTDVLLFPETSFGYYDMDRITAYPEINELLTFLRAHEPIKLITGISSYKLYNEDTRPKGRDLHVINRTGKTYFLEPQNSAICLNPDGTYDTYLKSKFVPGAEIFPYKKFLPFLSPLVKKLGGSMSDWGKQKERSTFKVDNAFVAPAICYESIFGQYCGDYIKKGAQAIFVVTNDGWWDNTMGHKQHALFSRLRAIEHRKPVVRSANLGWSCFINQRGDISHQNEYGVMGCVQDTILVNNKRTVYTIWGDVIARVAVFMTILVLLSALMYRFRKK